MIEKMNAEAARLNNVLPLGQQPEGNLDPMGKLEEARDGLFKTIDILSKNLKIFKQKNAELEEGVKELVKQVKTLENKNGHK
jgi:archaellum component FlaC